MKNSLGQTNNQSKPGAGQRPKPEQRDNLDSRKNEEQQFKGDDVTHNEKKTKEDKLKDTKN